MRAHFYALLLASCLALTACGGGGGTTTSSSGTYSVQALDQYELLAISSNGHALVFKGRAPGQTTSYELHSPAGVKTTLATESNGGGTVGFLSDSGEYSALNLQIGEKYYQNGSEISFTWPTNFTPAIRIDDNGFVYGTVTDSSAPAGLKLARFNGTTLETSNLPVGTTSYAWYGEQSFAQYLRYRLSGDWHLASFNPDNTVTEIRNLTLDDLTITSVQGADALFVAQGSSSSAVVATGSGSLTTVTPLKAGEVTVLKGTLSDGSPVGNSLYSPAYAIYPALFRPIYVSQNSTELLGKSIREKSAAVQEVLAAKGNTIVTRYVDAESGVNGIAVLRQK